MEYIKDKFKVSEILDAEQQIKQRLKEFLHNNKLTAVSTRYNNTINLVTGTPTESTYSEKIIDFDSFIDNKFSIFTEPEKTPTHNIITILYSDYYRDVYQKLTDTAKAIFLKTISNHKDNNHLANYVSNSLPDDDFFNHLRYISPFGKGSKQGWIFKTYQRALKNRSIDSDDKVKSLFHFFHYYKPIVKRTDTINSVSRYIEQSVPEIYHENFEKLLGTKIDNQVESKDYISSEPQVIVIKIDKAKIFQQLPLKHFPQAEVGTYNGMISTIVTSLNTVLKEKVGIEHTYVEELCSQNKPCRVYIEPSNSGFKCDVKDLFYELMEISSSQYQPNNRNEMKKIHEDAFNYYTIKTSINEKNAHETENKKTNKIKI